MRVGGMPWFDVDARMHPLALATLGRFMPSAGLRGTASGPVRLRGSINDLAINTQLTFPDGGFLDLRGTMDLASRETGYNLEFTTRSFNASSAITKAPQTSITAVGSARGRGTDPATMQAQIVADVAASTVDTVSLDRANVSVAIANGIARFDTLAVELPQGIVEAKGTFGLAPGHDGALSYHIAIDSLSRFAGLISTDTAVVRPRPGILAARVARAKADSSRIARATEVERAITGRAVPRTVVDTPKVVRRNELSGSARADGVATGNIKNFTHSASCEALNST